MINSAHDCTKTLGCAIRLFTAVVRLGKLPTTAAHHHRHPHILANIRHDNMSVEGLSLTCATN